MRRVADGQSERLIECFRCCWCLGSEVSTLMAGVELLRKEGIRLQIVSVPSEGLFRQQPKEYQEEVLAESVYKQVNGLL